MTLSTRSFLKLLEDPQNSQDKKSTILVPHDCKSELPNNVAETPVPDSVSISISSNDNKKVSREDIELVQNLIERCLQLYMNKDVVVKTLLNRARIDPRFTNLVWQKLEEENPDFFRAYYIRLKLKKQIISFNNLLQHQYDMMKYPVSPKVPLVPMQNGIHPIRANNLPVGYPVMHQPSLTATGQPHIDPLGYSTTSCHIVNGIPAPGHYIPMHMNPGNGSTMIDTSGADVSPIMPPNNGMPSMSDMPVSPTSVASSSHFPFTASEISGMEVDTSALDTAFTSDVANSVELHLPPENRAENSRDSLRSLDHIQWNFSLSDLTADLSNLEDLGALGNYPGSPFLASDSDILLDSTEQDDTVEQFFVDSDLVPAQCQLSDEVKHRSP
ncbi:hypothetical protein F511_30420 [Dorcoceras hygrometricum]|uniref:Uncharacterized protein n=1 Tax=Dorcoceras hygrometricum TaxID=472368 RepID=A0A2Z7DHN3_9LAMI|nr:hypothetical protein F511_30420 [Dorcoceras hygrometricum]